MYRHVISTKQDFIDELNELSFVNKCDVKEKGYLVIIYVKISLINYLFKKVKILDDIHTLLRPKVPLNITYEIKMRLFL